MTDKQYLKKKRIAWLLLIIAAAICIFAATLCYTGLGVFIPSWVMWQDKSFSANEVALRDNASDSDATTGIIQCELKNKDVTLYDAKGKMIWKSGRGLKVQDAFITDIDSDGDYELLLLVWKRGKYGEHKPFWVTKDTTDYTQHIFIYDIEDDGARPKWFASDIGREVVSMSVEEKDMPIAITTDRDGEVLHWAWFSFGLTNID